jgi:SAM-dependent methyltransferase
MRCEGCGSTYPEEGGILRLVVGRAGPPGFSAHYFGALAPAEDRHFWFVARRKLILDVLRRSVPDLASRRLFDIGCGSGAVLAFLAEAGVSLAGACDAYLEGLERARERLPCVPLALVDEGRPLPLGPGQSMVSLFDVLEHVDDDQATLNGLAEILEPGGVLVLTVPAHPFLYDEADALAHHRRRYRRSDLRGKLEKAGFEVRRLTHFMAPLVPALIGLRFLGQLLPLSTPERRRNAEFTVVPFWNEVLERALAVERVLLRVVSLPLGTSLIAVAARGR